MRFTLVWQTALLVAAVGAVAQAESDTHRYPSKDQAEKAININIAADMAQEENGTHHTSQELVEKTIKINDTNLFGINKTDGRPIILQIFLNVTQNIYHNDGCCGNDTKKCKRREFCRKANGTCVKGRENCKGTIISEGCDGCNCFCCVNIMTTSPTSSPTTTTSTATPSTTSPISSPTTLTSTATSSTTSSTSPPTAPTSTATSSTTGPTSSPTTTTTQCVLGGCQKRGFYYEIGDECCEDCSSFRCVSDCNWVNTKIGCPGTCQIDGKCYQPGTVFKENCMEFRCENGTWKFTKFKPTCKPCSFRNDPHFSTFDDIHFDWHGHSTYVISQVGCGSCPDSFVYSKFADCLKGHKGATCAHSVYFQTDRNTFIQIVKAEPVINSEITIDGYVQTLNEHNEGDLIVLKGHNGKDHPVFGWHRKGCINIMGFKAKGYLVTICRWGSKVLAYPSMKNTTCGLCGNWDDIKSNDLMFKNGTVINPPLQPSTPYKWIHPNKKKIDNIYGNHWEAQDCNNDSLVIHNVNTTQNDNLCNVPEDTIKDFLESCTNTLESAKGLISDVEKNRLIDECVFDICIASQTGNKTIVEEWSRLIKEGVQEEIQYNNDTGDVETLKGDNGFLSYPKNDNYHYRNSEDRSWVIITNGSIIEITFTRFHLEEGYDFIYIRDGDDDCATLLGKYTGEGDVFTITTSSNKAFINMKTDAHVTMNGFSLSWSATDIRPGASGNSIDCSQRFTTDTGSLQFPLIDNYHEHSDCNWAIETYGPRIELRFTHIKNALFNRISFSIGDGNNECASTLCDPEYYLTNLPLRIITTSNEAFIHFTVSHWDDHHHPEFNLSWKTIATTESNVCPLTTTKRILMFNPGQQMAYKGHLINNKRQWIARYGLMKNTTGNIRANTTGKRSKYEPRKGY